MYDNYTDWKLIIGIGLCVLVGLFGFVGSCNQTQSTTPPPITRLTDFVLGSDDGVFSVDFKVKNMTNYTIESAKITVIVTREDASKTNVDRYWATWKPGEIKIINVPASPRMQRTELTGQGSIDDRQVFRRVALSGTWNMTELHDVDPTGH